MTPLISQRKKEFRDDGRPAGLAPSKPRWFSPERRRISGSSGGLPARGGGHVTSSAAYGRKSAMPAAKSRDTSGVFKARTWSNCGTSLRHHIGQLCASSRHEAPRPVRTVRKTQQTLPRVLTHSARARARNHSIAPCMPRVRHDRRDPPSRSLVPPTPNSQSATRAQHTSEQGTCPGSLWTAGASSRRVKHTRRCLLMWAS